MGSFFSKSSWDPEQSIGDLSGKVALVTGANTGMGYTVVEQLALHQAKVYLAACSEDRAKAAIDKLRMDHPEILKSNLIWLPLDLTTVGDVRKTAALFLAQEKRLDILINNAAKLASDFVLNNDGVEEGVAVNHIGHFVLVEELLPLLKETAAKPKSDVRIITVASQAHSFVPVAKFDSISDLNTTFAPSGASLNAFKAKHRRYGLTKLMNILYARELQKRLDSEGVDILSISLHPGLVATENALRLFPAFLAPLLRPFGKTALQGGTTTLFAATATEVKLSQDRYKGAYLFPYGQLQKPTPLGSDDKLASNLWKLTEEFVAGLDASKYK